MSRDFVFPDTNAPRDPIIESLVRMSRSAASTGLSRRSLLAGAGAAGLLSLLAACGTGGTTPSGGGATSAGLTPATDLSDTEKTVRWSNWTLYLDYDDASGKVALAGQCEPRGVRPYTLVRRAEPVDRCRTHSDVVDVPAVVPIAAVDSQIEADPDAVSLAGVVAEIDPRLAPGA